MTLRLTKFQVEEVSGLLDVCSDDYANGDRDNEGWGVLAGQELTVLDAKEAAEDLRWRAEFLITEGASTAGARSLEKLAETIAKGVW